MDDYLEFEKDPKALKSIKLDDLSTDELHKYIKQLNNESSTPDNRFPS